jgi:hypothetical protein
MFEAAFLAALIFVAIEAGLTLHRVQEALPGMVADVHNMATDYERMAQDVVGVTGEVRRTLKQTQNDSARTAANIAGATETLNVDLEKLGTFEVDADAALKGAQAQGGALTVRANKTIDALNETIGGINRDAGAAGETITHFDETTQRVLSDPLIHDSFVQADGTLANVNAESGLIVAKTKKAFAPKNRVLSVMQMIGGNTVTGAELFYYLTH